MSDLRRGTWSVYCLLPKNQNKQKGTPVSGWKGFMCMIHYTLIIHYEGASSLSHFTREN